MNVQKYFIFKFKSGEHLKRSLKPRVGFDRGNDKFYVAHSLIVQSGKGNRNEGEEANIKNGVETIILSQILKVK